MTFDFVKTINYWSDSAAYDLETGESLLELKRYPYALFFGHLALEKILKALRDVYQWLSRKLKD